jgi:hypothetical protein
MLYYIQAKVQMFFTFLLDGGKSGNLEAFDTYAIGGFDPEAQQSAYEDAR